MSNYTNLADFSSEGLNIGKDAKVMAYLHGLSDFWVYMFDDASKVNMMMEANAVTASDIYNKFLQLTSVISLDGISTLTNAQTKLVLISEDDAIAGKVETYAFPKDVALRYARCLTNRAFLPTITLENEIDFFIDESTGYVSFAKPLSTLGFPFRTLASGAKEYAVWAIDARIDDSLVYKYYAKLLDINPTSSTDSFKNFVYGMYYLFVNGPHLQTVRRGLNLALGIPLARDSETVLEIRKYLSSDQWLVITDLNSYLVPYGLEPTVELDQQLSTGDEIASWIEVKDYEQDGEWWANFMLPSHLMPHIPTAIPGGDGINADPAPDRYMVANSYADYLMRNYLKNHTFLVNVKTVGFKNIQAFEDLANIIREVKPSYTTPIYVWTVPIDVEILELQETLTKRIDAGWCEIVTEGMTRFSRNETEPHLRGCCPLFIRMSGPAVLDDQLGLAPEINGPSKGFNGGTLTGYIAPQDTYKTLTAKEAGWDRAMRRRDADQYIPKRGMLDYKRDRTDAGDGQAVFPLHNKWPGYRMVALHTTTLQDVAEKFAACSQIMPNTYLMPMLEPSYTIMDLINANAIDDIFEDSAYDFIMANFNFLFNKGTNGRYLGPMFPEASQFAFVPQTSEVTRGDFFLFTRIDDTHCGAYWMTRNFAAEVMPYRKHEEPDQIAIETTGRPTRGGALMGSPYYFSRGVDVVTYEDAFNTSFPRDRSGRTLKTRRVFK